MEGAPKTQSQESNDSLVEKVKGLESKIKKLKLVQRITFLTAMVAGLSFTSEKIDNMNNLNTKKFAFDKLEKIEHAVDKLNEHSEGDTYSIGYLADIEGDIESIRDAMIQSEKNPFDKLTEVSESRDLSDTWK